MQGALQSVKAIFFEVPLKRSIQILALKPVLQQLYDLTANPA